MSALLDAVNVLNERLVSADAIGKALDLAGGENAPPDGHFKFPHLWPVKFPQAGRLNYQLFGQPGSDFLSW
nr:hypothetical protein [Rhodoferax sp.]